MQFEIFDNLLTAPQTVSNTYDPVAQAQSCANHVQHIKRLSQATCHATYQLLSLTEFKSRFFELYLIGWTIKLMEEGDETRVPAENPWRWASENATY